MKRFECQGELLITCTSDGESQTLRVILSHSQSHAPYSDISIPPEAIDIIRDNIAWALPNIIEKVQSQYPRVTKKQITNVWAKVATNCDNEGEEDVFQDAHNPAFMTYSTPDSSTPVGPSEPAWGCLASRAFLPHEVIPLIEAILMSEDEVKMVGNLCGDDAQKFVDVIHEVSPSQFLHSRCSV